MHRFMFQMSFILALVFTGIWSTGTALAEKPDWPGYKKREINRYQDNRENNRYDSKRQDYSDRQERREDYREERRENYKDRQERREDYREERRENYKDRVRRENNRYEERHDNNRYDRMPAFGFSDGGNRHETQRSQYFSDDKKKFIHQYYSDRFRQGRCPPGFIKKGNRCIPPGHARMWRKGRPLPREVIYYSLPANILVQLGPPPPRHRFVRVDQDILLISIATGIVLDAFENFDRWD